MQPTRSFSTLFCLALLSTASGASDQALEVQKLLPSDGVPHMSFGGAIAIEGNTIAVGAMGDGSILFAGAVYVFVKEGGSWQEQAKLNATLPFDFDHFGSALDFDGERLAVGAPYSLNDGRAYVFKRSGSSWQMEAELPSPGASFGQFGTSVGLHGRVLAVGAWGPGPNVPDSGRVFFYSFDGASWLPDGELTPGDWSIGLGFGFDLELRADELLVGAPWGDSAGTGSAYLFQHGAGQWSEVQKFEPSDGLVDDRFGHSVAFAGDRVAIGAPYHAGSGGLGSGAVYVYADDGGWAEEAQLVSPSPAIDEKLGFSVAGSEAGVLAGAWGASAGAPGSGEAWWFAPHGGFWIAEDEIVASDGADGDFFGISVASSGQQLAVGAFRDALWAPDDNSGSAYVFELEELMPTFCAGDGSSIPCPCGNASPSGSELGCSNSAHPGAYLEPSGGLSLAAGDLRLWAHGLLPGAPALLFVGDSQAGGGVLLGDGIRCAGGNLIRLGVEAPSAAGSASWGPGLELVAGWQPGDLRYLQVWYRDPGGLPCGAGFNLTNGLRGVFQP